MFMHSCAMRGMPKAPHLREGSCGARPDAGQGRNGKNVAFCSQSSLDHPSVEVKALQDCTNKFYLESSSCFV